MKKIVAFLLCMLSSVTCAMEREKLNEINGKRFFEVCKLGVIAAQEFIQRHPAIDINYQNEHGTTIALCIASCSTQRVIDYLLQECWQKIDKMHTDKHGQTLLSQAVNSTTSCFFKKILSLYSWNEINSLCGKMCLGRNLNGEPMQEVYSLITDVLEGKKELEYQNSNGYTALCLACLGKQVPFIIQLLEHGANLNTGNNYGETPYDYLSKNFLNNKAPLFAVREAFNREQWLSAALICEVSDNVEVEDVAHYIKQLYVEIKYGKKPFESPKARIWQPVCVDACKAMGITEKDEKRCLVSILMAPQDMLTKANIALALQDK